MYFFCRDSAAGPQWSGVSYGTEADASREAKEVAQRHPGECVDVYEKSPGLPRRHVTTFYHGTPPTPSQR